MDSRSVGWLVRSASTSEIGSRSNPHRREDGPRVNGQFTLTLEESSSDEIGRFRIFVTKGGGERVQVDPGSRASLTAAS